jgi:hypothetical protein
MWDQVFAWEACLWKSKNPDFVSEVQSFLGRGTHSVDGVIDEDLRDKVRGFQSTFHLPITGDVDRATSKAVHSAIRAADEEYERMHQPASIEGTEAASVAVRPFS